MNSITQYHTEHRDEYISDIYDYVVGVDTHAATHTMVMLDKKREKIGNTRVIRVTQEQMLTAQEAVRKIVGDGKVLWAIEGTSSYGETLTRLLLKSNAAVIEVKPPKTKSRTKGKTDEIDAQEAAKTALATKLWDIIMPKTGDLQKKLQMLLMGRETCVKHHTMLKNTLIAHLRRIDLGVNVCGILGENTVKEISKWHISKKDDSCINVARKVARDYAKDIISEKQARKNYDKQLKAIVKELCPELLKIKGFGGPYTSAVVLEAFSYKGRIKSANAFCALAGVAPIPASSGKTDRHRLNRKGDRRLNHALDIATKARLSQAQKGNDAKTAAYKEKLKAQGKSDRDIRRSLKRNISRSVFRFLNKQNIEP